MRALQIRRPYCYVLKHLLSETVVSYSVRMHRVAIGRKAVQLTSDEMNEVLNPFIEDTERFDIIAYFFSKKLKG